MASPADPPVTLPPLDASNLRSRPGHRGLRMGLTCCHLRYYQTDLTASLGRRLPRSIGKRNTLARTPRCTHVRTNHAKLGGVFWTTTWLYIGECVTTFLVTSAALLSNGRREDVHLAVMVSASHRRLIHTA